jgi:hypothetical protein
MLLVAVAVLQRCDAGGVGLAQVMAVLQRCDTGGVGLAQVMAAHKRGVKVRVITDDGQRGNRGSDIEK